MQEYKIIIAATVASKVNHELSLEEQVNTLLEAGWKTHGYLCMSECNGGLYVAQAMVRMSPKLPSPYHI